MFHSGFLEWNSSVPCLAYRTEPVSFFVWKTGPYLVHKAQLVHKCTKPTRDVHREINGRRTYCKEALPRRTKLDVDFCENPPPSFSQATRTGPSMNRPRIEPHDRNSAAPGRSTAAAGPVVNSRRATALPPSPSSPTAAAAAFLS
jgi:hypothetical protein